MNLTFFLSVLFKWAVKDNNYIILGGKKHVFHVFTKYLQTFGEIDAVYTTVNVTADTLFGISGHDGEHVISKSCERC